MFTKSQKLLWLYSLWIFHRGVKWYHIRALGYNLLIRPRVQVYFHSDTCYIINGNLGLVKSWQICLRPIGARTLFIPLVSSQATYKSPIGLAQKEEKTVFLCSIFWVHFFVWKSNVLKNWLRDHSSWAPCRIWMKIEGILKSCFLNFIAMRDRKIGCSQKRDVRCL